MPESEKAHLVQRFVDAAEILNRLFFYQRIETLGGVELTMPQVKTLAVLESRGPLYMTSMAFLMNRTVSAMTSIVDRLVERGLIARQSDPHDRRRVICASRPPAGWRYCNSGGSTRNVCKWRLIL